MKTTLKRLLCLVLSVMFFTMSLPVLAADVADVADENTTTETVEVELTPEELPAEKPGGMKGSGQKNDPLIIDSAEDLCWFAEQVNNGYNKISAKLAADIDLNEGFKFSTGYSATGDSVITTVTFPSNKKTYTVTIKDGDVEGKTNAVNKFGKNVRIWTPIGQSAAGENDGFCGVFDAFQYNEKGEIVGEYSISGIYINGGKNEVGLFGHVGHAEIRGVKVENSYIRGNEKVGAIAGFAHHEASFVGCWNANSSVVFGVKNVGGIVGALDAEGGALQDIEEDHLDECVNRGHVHGKTNVGGILGYGYWAVIRDCFNVNDPSVDEEGNLINPNAGLVHGEKCVGGIVGLSNGAAIYGCSKYADVKATGNYVGGIAGHLEGTHAYLREVVNGATATVTGKVYVGGIVGSLGRTANGDTVVRELFMSYNHGTVNGNDYVGGLVGYNEQTGKVFNSYSSGPVLVTNTDATSKNASNGNIVGFNEGEVRDCFYYPKKNAEVANAIGNGIGNASTGTKSHVIGFVPDFMKTEAAAYLLNLVYLGEAEGEGTDVHEVGYHHMATQDRKSVV